MDKMTALEQELQDKGIHCLRDVSLKDYTTFKIGGNAAIMIFPATEEEIAASLRAIRQSGVPLLVLGRGSNMLFSDDGFLGAILCLSGRFSRMEQLDKTAIACQSGASLTQLCRYACELGLSGLEFAYGIPGTVGGAIYMNAGAYGGEICDVLEQTRHLTADGVAGSCGIERLEMSYRHSVYTDSDNIITEGVFRLRPGNPQEIRATMEDFLRRRKEKQPVELPSAGSVFRRPAGSYASALVDQCGLKGLRVGGAQVSTKHAGFIVNTGGATCRDVRELIAKIQEDVQNKTGYRLECEVKTIG